MGSVYRSPEQTEQIPTPSEVLTDLLSQQPYRDMWGQFIQRRRGNRINVRAVAALMAYELSDIAGIEMSPNQFKDSVRRALSGELITDRTIHRFISTFGFQPEETQLLWKSMVHMRQHDYALSPPQEALADQPNPQQDRTVLSQAITVTCNSRGLVDSIEIIESFRVEQDSLHYFKPLIEGHSVSMSLLDGGEITEVSISDTHRGDSSGDQRYEVHIKPPTPLKHGEIHRYHLLAHLSEMRTVKGDYNHFRVGTEEGTKFNVTLMMNFAQPAQDIRRCVWENRVFTSPVLEEQLPAGLTSYSSHHPTVQASFFGFRWHIPPITGNSKNHS